MLKDFLSRGVLMPFWFHLFGFAMVFQMDLSYYAGIVWVGLVFPTAGVLGMARLPLPVALACSLWVPAVLVGFDLFAKAGVPAPFFYASTIFPSDPYGGRAAYIGLCALSALAGWLFIQVPFVRRFFIAYARLGEEE